MSLLNTFLERSIPGQREEVPAAIYKLLNHYFPAEPLLPASLLHREKQCCIQEPLGWAFSAHPTEGYHNIKVPLGSNERPQISSLPLPPELWMQLRKLWELQLPCIVISRLHFHLPEISHAPDRRLISISHAVRPSHTPPKGWDCSSRGQFPGESHQPSRPSQWNGSRPGWVISPCLSCPLLSGYLGLELSSWSCTFSQSKLALMQRQKSHLDLELTVRLWGEIKYLVNLKEEKKKLEILHQIYFQPCWDWRGRERRQSFPAGWRYVYTLTELLNAFLIFQPNFGKMQCSCIDCMGAENILKW